jgi:hypothetical protein
MQRGHGDSAQARVQRAIADLGTDAESAPPVPAGVSTRIVAALRAQPVPAAHSAVLRRPVSRIRLVAVVVGLIAVAVAVAVVALSRQGAAPRFPSGPTADQITVSVTERLGDTPKPVVTHQ